MLYFVRKKITELISVTQMERKKKLPFEIKKLNQHSLSFSKVKNDHSFPK